VGVSESNAEIRRARAAAERGSWREAYDALRAADPEVSEPEELELLADAAWWLSRMDESIAARQRAYTGYAGAGDAVRAAWMAGRLSVDHFTRGEPAVGAGWLMKARRQADEVEETAGHGQLLVVEATVARYTGDLERAAQLADRAGELARRFRDPDLTAMATHTRGLILIATGDVSTGLALLDEAMTSVVAGELSPFFTGVVYCNVIGACLELADVGRAGEWSDAARVWCESLPPESPFPGMCRINRAEVLRLRGAWAEAEAEAVRASEELRSFDPGAAAQALYEIGEIRRRLGNVAGAEDAFARARERGFEPQPGLALLRLAQGKSEAALAALRIAVSAPIESRLRRARVLAAQVEVALAMQDVETARTAVAELDAISTEGPIAALDATAATAQGALALADDDISTALDRLRHASGLWQRLGLPYEHAQARGLYGAALRAAGDREEGDLELRAALSAYEALGAVTDADEVAGVLAGGLGLPRGLTAREAEVLRLVAAGKTNREIASELVISEHTVARHLQNMFVKLQVSSRSAATAFAFEHGIT
jgi:ATP/maltotriose-dependent transcriptional regulator MalT